MVLVEVFMTMERHKKGDGLIIKPRVKVFIVTMMKQFMRVHGKMITKKALGQKVGKTGQNMRVNLKKEKRMEKANLYGVIELNMKENL